MDTLTPDNLAALQKEKRSFSIGQVSGAAAFGGPIAGGWLLFKNIQSSGDPDSARSALFFSAGFLVLLTLLASYLPTDFPKSIGPAVLGGGYYYWYKQAFNRQYSEHIGAGGEKASNWKVIWAVAVALPVSIVVMFVVTIVVPITPMNYLSVGENSIYYEGDANREDAVRLGRFLTEQGVFYGSVGWEIGVDFPRGRSDEVFLKAPMEAPTKESDSYLAIQELVGEAESQLYPGKQVTFTVLNEFGISTMRISND